MQRPRRLRAVARDSIRPSGPGKLAFACGLSAGCAEEWWHSSRKAGADGTRPGISEGVAPSTFGPMHIGTKVVGVFRVLAQAGTLVRPAPTSESTCQTAGRSTRLKVAPSRENRAYVRTAVYSVHPSRYGRWRRRLADGSLVIFMLGPSQ